MSPAHAVLLSLAVTSCAAAPASNPPSAPPVDASSSRRTTTTSSTSTSRSTSADSTQSASSADAPHSVLSPQTWDAAHFAALVTFTATHTCQGPLACPPSGVAAEFTVDEALLGPVDAHVWLAPSNWFPLAQKVLGTPVQGLLVAQVEGPTADQALCGVAAQESFAWVDTPSSSQMWLSSGDGTLVSLDCLLMAQELHTPPTLESFKEFASNFVAARPYCLQTLAAAREELTASIARVPVRPSSRISPYTGTTVTGSFTRVRRGPYLCDWNDDAAGAPLPSVDGGG